MLSQGSVALRKESFESGTRCKPDIWARPRRRAGDTWAGGFPGGGRSPRRGPGAGPRLASCESWAGRGDRQVVRGLVGQGGSPGVPSWEGMCGDLLVQGRRGPRGGSAGWVMT